MHGADAIAGTDCDEVTVSKKESDPCCEWPLGGRYEWLREIGRGGFGAIQRAVDPRIGRDVAVKVMNREDAIDSDSVKAFYEEAQIAGQLDHPNVVPIYDLGGEDQDEGPYMVMKLVRGDSLATMIGKQRTRAEHGEVDLGALRSFVEILLKLCDALSFAHSRGVIHCDLKPDNIMVGHHGEVYLMDWGVALVLGRRADSSVSHAPEAHRAGQPTSAELRAILVQDTDTAQTVRLDTQSSRRGFRGTPAFMAPEQLLARVENIDERTDVFGMGAVLYNILTGAPPNTRENLLNRAVGLDLPSTPTVSPLWHQLPPGLCQIALKALAPVPEHRYQSIRELRRALEQFLEGGGWFETCRFADGEYIVREGETGDVAYIIESGECDVLKNVDGQPQVMRRLTRGGVFGETAVLTAGPRTASVVAVGDVTLKVISADSLNHELDRNPWLAAFVRSLATLFREADQRLSGLPSGE